MSCLDAPIQALPPSKDRVEWQVGEFLFDMDGTLIDSIAAVEDAWRRWALLEEVDVPTAAEFHGRTAADLVSSLLPPERVGTALARLNELEQRPTLAMPLTPGALALVASLPPDRWTIVTSAAEPVAQARIRASGLPTPERLITGDAVSRGKPDPEPYRRGIRWASSTAPAVAFEDTVAGLRSARAAGCLTVGVLGTHPVGELRPHADAIVASLADVTVLARDGDCLLVELLALT